MNWKRWLGQYERVSPMEFERWLFARFRRKYRNRTVVRLKTQDLLHLSLWKLGHRQLENVATNENVPPLTLPGPDLAGRMPGEIENTIRTLMRPLERLKGFGVCAASAVLTVLRPKVFSPIDKYAIRGVRECLRGRGHPGYERVAELAERSNLTSRDYATHMMSFWYLPNLYGGQIGDWSFRDVDRALWAFGKWGCETGAC